MAFKTSADHQPRCADHDPPGELVLCRRLDPDAAANTLKRLDFVAVQNGRGLGRDVMMEGLIDESCYPETSVGFRLEEGGQFIVRQQSTVPYMDGSRVWIRLCFERPASSCWVSHRPWWISWSALPNSLPARFMVPCWACARSSNVIVPFLECLVPCLVKITGAKARYYD